MLTLKEIAAKLGTTVSKARTAVARAGVAPVVKSGRTHLYADDCLPDVIGALDSIRKYNRAKSTKDTPADETDNQPQGGSETADVAIPQVESDTQADTGAPSVV